MYRQSDLVASTASKSWKDLVLGSWLTLTSTIASHASSSGDAKSSRQQQIRVERLMSKYSSGKHTRAALLGGKATMAKLVSSASLGGSLRPMDHPPRTTVA
jgi:hypothetical protein